MLVTAFIPFAEVPNVSAVVAAPPVGVTVGGENEQAENAGRFEQLKERGELKLVGAVIEIVKEACCPVRMVAPEG